VTAACVALYLTIIAIPSGLSATYVMRAAYLAIAGYLIGFFGQERAKYEARLRRLETVEEREAIARSLHDGYVQALAGVNLRLGTCGELLTRGRQAEALQEMAELRLSVGREYDDIRAYLRSLANLEQKIRPHGEMIDSNTRFHVDAVFSASGINIEQFVQVMLEGMRNTSRHGKAQSSTITVRDNGKVATISIDDDGVGFGGSMNPPWTIASRVAAYGGEVSIRNPDQTGAHLRIWMPTQ